MTTITNKTRLKRLNQLKFMLENHSTIFPDVKFDMRTFGEPYECGPKGVCRYAACALGSAAAYPPFRKHGLEFESDEYSLDFFEVQFEDKVGYEAGAAFFGITFRESAFLFSPGGYYSHPIKHRHVISRINQLIKKYSIQGHTPKESHK